MATTTAVTTSFKVELLEAGHCFLANISFTANTTNASASLASVSSLAGLSVGMLLSGTNIPASTYIVTLSGTTIVMSNAATGTGTGITISASADAFKMALIKAAPTGTYGAASTNYSNITGNSDETTGTGYTAGGTALTNVTPSNPSGTTAITNFSPNPSWTSATFSTTACMIYNSSARLGTTGRAVSTHDFGGTQTVSAGTFTVVMPTADATNAILRIA